MTYDEQMRELMQAIADLKAQRDRGVVLSLNRPSPTPASGMIATAERGRHGPIGQEEHSLENGAKVRRSRVHSPMSLPVTRQAALQDAQRAAIGEAKETPKLKLSQLDKALTEAEAHALARFYEGTVAAAGRAPGGSYGQSTGRSAPGERIPLSEKQRRDIQARQHIWRRLPFPAQRDIDLLCRWIANDGSAPISAEQWALKYGATGDRRVAQGVFVGSIKRLAEQVNELLVEFEIQQSRVRNEKRQEAERKTLLMGNGMEREIEENQQ